MKRLTTLLLWIVACSISMQAHTYVNSSNLSSGNIVKLQVNSTGLYSLSYEQIQAMGITPQKVRILGYGGNLIPQNFTLERVDDVPSIPFYMNKGADGVFSEGDYIIFYANGPVGWDWSNSYFVRTRNCYADYGCYFISDSAGEQLLLQPGEEIEAGFAYDVYSYTALQVHEQDKVNLIDITNGKEGGGREWYGELFNQTSSTLTLPFSFQDVDTSQTLTCRVEAVAASSSTSSMKVEVSGGKKTINFTAIPVTDFYSKGTVGKTTISSATPVSNSLPVTLTYSTSLASATAYLNFVEMQVPCLMKLSGNSLFIRNTEHVGSNLPSKYHLTGANQYTQVWNMTKPTEAYIVPTTLQGDTMCWIGSNDTPQLFIAVRTNVKDWSAPASRGRVPNQNLHKILLGKQHIIITPEEFSQAAAKLKQAHEQYNPSESWCVVTDEQVYNEFSSGTPDASAYRWMMKYLYDTNKETELAPKTLLLFGDGSFDNRKILKTSPVPYLLTYQAENSIKETDAYATDDYFGWLEDKGGVYGSKWDDKRATMQIGVGRLPVRTYEEAEDMVEKLTAYMRNESHSNWKQQLCFLADDGDQNTHTQCADQAAVAVAQAAPDFVVNKIYLDSYEQETSASGESYPVAYNTFCNLLQSGVMLMDYAGHGSANNICSEMFLTRKQVENMTNTNQGVWALATCNFAHFDQSEQSTAEIAVLNKLGGAIGVMSADRTVYASENAVINKYFCANLFEHTDPFTYVNTIGEALRLAKNSTGSSSINKLPFLLLGDPSIKLNYPCQYRVVITEMPDTLHALDLVTIRGYISMGDTMLSAGSDTVDYTGLLHITVYDKQQTIATRDNDESDESKKQIYYFQDYPNKIFAGEADIKDGLFTVQFRVPKDIRYSMGLGRMTLYATGVVNAQSAEAIGHYEQFCVGGSSKWIIDDTQGPNMHIYLNTPFFIDGDVVNRTPHFYADLSDENGINTIGSGIGHDIKLVLDNSPKQTYILNNYYTANNNSFTQGTVSYILPELTDGYHSLSFQAWDLLNNATSETIGFTVDTASGPSAISQIVYPIPVSKSGTLHMLLANDRPDDLLFVDVAFYDLMGRKIWSTYRSLIDNNVDIDMLDSSLQPGSYVYQFTIQTTTQVSKKYSGRLIVY